ncbi:hypothetical protein B9Z55_021601 [Caenorhabditis nigoni]|uniref:F-box domain-containing protein n=1 Tax=Caenorhabditis nigoni TaxID=1611254 RepID=A0A2G5TSP2_9PELO|nr:hypothetical protein B9Z55_021601 [Caenorhabditis nigoni]
MPIRLLSLPDKDLQYALNCMDICDLIALSLCSKQTKNFAKLSNRYIEPISVQVYDNYVRFEIIPWDIHQPIIPITFLASSDSRINLDRGNGAELWRKRKFTQSDWIAHFLSIFDESMIDELVISDFCPISYLDNVKQIIPKCGTLRIPRDCSMELTKAAILKLAPLAEEVEVNKNIFIDDISLFLSYNLNALVIIDRITPLKLELSDLLVLNITDLTVVTANVTGRELNRFLKLWMKGNYTFYRPKSIEFQLNFGMPVNCEEVFKGIKYATVDNRRRLTRADGKELLITFSWIYVDFKFL